MGHQIRNAVYGTDDFWQDSLSDVANDLNLTAWQNHITGMK
jgi:hypothetical protein